MRYDHHVARVRASVLDAPAHTTPELRRAAANQRLGELPENLRAYVAKVGEHAWKVTDEDVADLKRAGYSEDAIYEITAAAAVGAAVRRIDAGMRVLRESAS